MKLSDFDYELPEEYIAQFPAEARDHSRLLVLRKENGGIKHRQFFQLIDELKGGDALVINDTKVFPARLFGTKETGGKAEILLLEKIGDQIGSKKGFLEEWTCLIDVSKPPKKGSEIFIDDSLSIEVESRKGEIYTVLLRSTTDVRTAIERKGLTPLPPYIKRSEPDRYERLDRERYQAVYAKEAGAVAAPTAGLHFTAPLLRAMKERGVNVVSITLRIGFGTFNPVREEDIEHHVMHSELCRITDQSAERINRTRKEGGRIIAVGTTAVRTLEFLSDENGIVRAGEAMNDLFIYPGYTFKTVDCMITNFHLPRSTLIMLVSAFAGRENILRAYEEAVREKYRFYSYGDSMLII